MSKVTKVNKPTSEEILKNVIQSFEIENIHISLAEGKRILKKVLQNLIKEKR